MSRVLIIGGCGYLGSALFIHLSMQGHAVESYDLELRGNPIGAANMEIPISEAQKSDLDRYDTVILLAAHSTVTQCVEDPIGAYFNNVDSPVHLLGQLQDRHNFIYASSGSVYSKTMFTMYDATKRAFDDMVTHLRPQSTGLRLGTVCGPSPNIRSTMLNGMVSSALANGHVSVSNPEARRPILGIGDFCRAIDLLIKKPQAGIFDLSSFCLTVRQAAEMVAATIGCEIRETPATPHYDFTMDQELRVAFRPRENLNSIIEDLVGFYNG